MQLHRLLLGVPLLLAGSPAFLLAEEATELPELLILADRYRSDRTTALSVKDSSIFPTADSAEVLSTVPGVALSRFGGHGLEPIIRGQQQNQLNVTADGSFTYGACPNRMDPPTSVSQFSLFDTVTVERGYQSVSRGPGGSGGAVRFEREIPAEGTKGRLGSSYNSNGSIYSQVLDASHSTEGLYGRASAQRIDAGNYEDGADNIIRSSFMQQSFIVEGGKKRSERSSTRAQLQYSETEDALFPGAGMDSPYTRALSPRVEHSQEVDAGPLKLLSASGYYSRVEHLMDNYSLRENNSTKLRVPADSDTFGGTVSGEFQLGEERILAGVDLQQNTRLAERFAVGQMEMLQAVLWPDLSIRQLGFFIERGDTVTPKLPLSMGLRLDLVRAEADLADRQICNAMGCTSPEMLYQRYYGEGYTPQDEVNPTAYLRYRLPVHDDGEVVFSLSHVTRTADATERSLASQSMMGNWVGNPTINPERHRTLDVGYKIGSEDIFSISGFANSVDDYILRDSARGQDVIRQADGADVYRNIRATLLGVESALSVELLPQLRLDSSLSFVRGEDEDRDAPLPQIPPLFGNTSLSYVFNGFTIAARTRYAATQTRVDTDPTVGTGRDIQETPEWFVTDIVLVQRLSQNFSLNLGVMNLFDRNFAGHLNRINTFDPVEVQVNEPGRSFFVRLEAVL